MFQGDVGSRRAGCVVSPFGPCGPILLVALTGLKIGSVLRAEHRICGDIRSTTRALLVRSRSRRRQRKRWHLSGSLRYYHLRFARRTGNLHSAIARVAGDVLLTTRTRKFDFGHNVGSSPRACPSPASLSIKRALEACSGRLHPNDELLPGKKFKLD